MESWLVKKKLNEAYNITQLRDVKKQEIINNEAVNQLAPGGNNPRTYKQWMTQQNNQRKYDVMSRAHQQQMQQELQEREEAKMGIEAQIQQINQGHQSQGQFQQQYQYTDGDEEDMEDEMDDPSFANPEMEQNDGGYNPLRQKY